VTRRQGGRKSENGGAATVKTMRLEKKGSRSQGEEVEGKGGKRGGSGCDEKAFRGNESFRAVWSNPKNTLEKSGQESGDTSVTALGEENPTSTKKGANEKSKKVGRRRG